MGKNPEKFQFPDVPFWYSLWYSLPCCRALSWQRTCTNYLPGCLPFIPTTCWGAGLKGGDFRLTSALSAAFRALLPFVMSCQFVQTCVPCSSTCVSAFSSTFQPLKSKICPKIIQVWLEFVQCYQKGNLQIPQSHNHTWSSCQLQRAHIWISIVQQQMSHI